MTKFILIEHSLKDVGGHHYDYAVHILQAAERAGYDIVLATHRQFRHQAQLPRTWKVLPMFRFDVYSKYAITSGSARNPIFVFNDRNLRSRNALVDWWNPRNWFEKRRYQCKRRLESFASTCEQLFQVVRLKSGDIVFLSTVSEYELQGLAKFLRRAPDTARAHWHLQFHHDILDGLEPSREQQGRRLQDVRRLFEQTLGPIRGHSLTFHTTTAPLAAQYNRLGTETFSELPYPVNPEFCAPGRTRVANEPLQITCAGGMRREKGKHDMAALVSQLWKPYLASGRAQFRIQACKGSFRRLLADQRQFGVDTRSGKERPPLLRIPHPLGLREYLRLHHTSDIGLFLYDSKRYYTRCSGILVEMLAAGVPVIVPAGCWLAEQIAEPTYRYLDQVRKEIPPVDRLGFSDVQWESPLAGKVLSFGGSSAVHGEVPVPRHAEALLVRFRHCGPVEPGGYVQIRAEQYSAQHERLDVSESTLGYRADRHVGTPFSLNDRTVRVRLAWKTAYEGGDFQLADLELGFLAGHEHENRIPLAAVGLAAANQRMIPKLFAEMVTHYDHYRQTAESFAHEWFRQHSPDHTLATLVSHQASTAGVTKSPAA